MAEATVNSKHELRQKLESMKKAYAQTLHKVQRSEKAQRTRSHVQQVIAEQSRVISNDASPLCTHKLSRRISSDGDVTRMLETLSPSVTGATAVESVLNAAVGEGSKTTMATKHMKRKRRSVSFSIPKENTTTKTPIIDAQAAVADSQRSTVKVHDQQANKMAAGFSGVDCVGQSSSLLVLSDDAARDSSRLDEKVTLVVPESQFTGSFDGSLSERSFTPTTATTPLVVTVPGRVKGNVVKSGNDIQNSVQSDSDLQKSASLGLNEMRQNDMSHAANVQLFLGDNGKTKDENDPESSPNSRQSSTEVRTMRASGKSRRRSRVPRELTASDINFKVALESQSTEEGSHTWIEGLMYPAEYYVRRTRSMTSSQCSQSQSSLDRANFPRCLDNDPTMTTRGQVSFTENSGSFKDSLTQEVATPTSPVNSQTKTSSSVPKSDSDSMKSQLSQSLLKGYPGLSVQECTKKRVSSSVKPTENSRNQRLQRKRGATSALWTDAKTKASIQTDSLVKSVSEVLLTVQNVRLHQTEFVLPEEDYGALKLVKLQSDQALDILSHTLNSEVQLEGLSDHLVGRQPTCLVTEKTVATELTSSSAGEEALKSGVSQHKETTTTQTNLIQNRSSSCCLNPGSETGGRHLKESRCRSILESQLSPTQFQVDRGNVTFPDPGCTPGWSPTCSPAVNQELAKPGGLHVPLSPGDKTGSLTCQKKDEQKGCMSRQNVNMKRKTTYTKDDSKCHNSNLSRNSSSHLPKTSPQNLQLNNSSNSPEDVRNSSLSALPISPGHSDRGDASPSTSRLQTVQKNLTAARSIVDVKPAGGNVTPTNAIQHLPVDPKGNIHQISPFAGVATGSPPGRAEEPISMSQCEVKISSKEDDEMSDETGRGSRNELALAGCLQHDLPWEALPTARDVTGSRMRRNDQDVGLLAIIYQHTLVVWWTSSDTQEWQIMNSWVLPEEEFLCVRFMPCSEDNTVSLVVTGVFATGSVRILSYNTVTEETGQLDVNLTHSFESPVQYLLCVTGEEEFAVAVKDDTGSALFLLYACIESRNVQMVKLWTGKETNLTSLLQVEGANGMLMAITSHNELMLWNCKTRELVKDMPMTSVGIRGSASCLKAVAETGLLFLVLIFPDDVSEQEAQHGKPIGATVVVNPLTDKMATLMKYQPSSEHAHASLVNAVIHTHCLLAKLSDGSLHQWDIYSGNLMNYSSSQPANHSLKSAHLCRSEVVLLGTGQCQQVYGAY